MLGDTPAIATIPVRDMHAATRFYEDVLGLTRAAPDRMGAVLYRAGTAQLLVYQSAFAGTNQATAVTWGGVDVDAVARALAERGVVFEHYDMPNVTREGDVHVGGGMRNAWFKDPDGNIHALVQSQDA
ncbi:MAG: VOC family protein [Gemmatirosa sp.]|nr:VOC family protein [Gemmatirosa sp.]